MVFFKRANGFRKIRAISSLGFAVLTAFSLVTASVAQTSAPTVASTVGPLMFAKTEGRGPSERVVEFLKAPNADKHRLPDENIAALSHALTAKNREAAQKARVELGIKALGTTQGVFGAMGTLAEHAAYLKSFGRANNALNNIGLVMAIAQVSRDAGQGKTTEALYGSMKAMVNYAIGRWGSSAMQIAGVATFIFDVTLSEWQSGLTDIGVNVWSCRYKAYYEAHGMTISQWKAKALSLYEFAEKDGNSAWFNTYLDGTLNEYVQRAFNSDALELYSECNGASFGDRDFIKRQIEAEHKGVLEQMIVEKVLPEIADFAWNKNLLQQISNANYELKQELNQTYLLEVTAYNAPEGARVVMPLPNGGEWGGNLRADGTFRAKLTYYALMKAGFPEKVILETSEGSESHTLLITDGKMTTQFGTPQTPIVVRYQLNESSQSCTLRRMEVDKPVTKETQTRPARGETTIDMATTMGGTMFLGKFDVENGWSTASPGRHTKDAMMFGAPYHDGILSLENCKFDILSDASLVEGECTIERFERKAVSRTVTIERICISPAQINLIGIFAALGAGEPQYYGMDTPEGKAAVKVMRDASRYAKEGRYPTSP